MIIGECPNCNGPLIIPLAEHCPCFQKHWCDKCGGLIWTLHSRLNPQSFNEEGFLEKYKVDEITKNITEK